MTLLSATALAEQIGVTKGRISQYVAEGKLDGCFEGDGRNRRFDLSKAAAALGKRLDPGQLMGNGAGTKKAIGLLDAGSVPEPRRAAGASQLPSDDSDRYNMARTLKAEEEARRLRRQNAEAEGSYVLASEVAIQTRRQIAQEVSEFENVIRDAARQVADECEVDFKVVRTIMLKTFRAHREKRAAALERTAEAAGMTAAEEAGQI